MRGPARLLSWLRWPAPRRSVFTDGLRGALTWALAVGLCELAWRAAAGATFDSAAVLRVLCLCAVSGLLLGTLAGLLRLAAQDGASKDGATEDTEPALGAAGGWRSFLWHGERDVQAARVTDVMAALGLLISAVALAVPLCHQVVVSMVRPHFVAVTVVALHVGLWLLAVVCWPFARRLAAAVVGRLSRVAGLRTLLRSAGGLLSTLVVLLSALVALSLLWFRDTLSYLPWPSIGGLVLGTLAAWLWRVGARARPASLGRVDRIVLPALVLLSLPALVQLESARNALREARSVLLARLSHELVLLALDVDGDGHLAVLGGGDCAPFDPRIGPAAVDIPNNQRDEDCDGADLDPGQLGVRTRAEWPVPASVPKKPPVVLITVDAFAARHLTALGEQRSVTPQLDALAARSTLFAHCFSQGPSTRLSFPSLFTSRWDSQIRREVKGRHPFPLEESEVTLAEVLSAEGYQPVAVLPDRYFTRARWGSLTSGFKRVIESPAFSRKQHNSREVTDAALSALAHSAKRPLFLWVHYYDAHSPHSQPTDAPVYGTRTPDVYAAELSLVDREVGRLLRGIETKLGGDALVVVSADHGIAFDAPRHSRFNYGYDLSTAVLHVPLIVNAAWIEPRVIDEVVSTMDIAPTVTNLVRARSRAPFEGASLLPALLRGEPTRPQRLLHEFYLPERLIEQEEPLEVISLRTDRYNLVHDRRIGTYELYDWRADYFELQDLADLPAHRATFVALKQQLAYLTYQMHATPPPQAAAAGTR